MERLAAWLGRVVRAFRNGMQTSSRWTVNVRFAHGIEERFTVNEETWNDIKSWVDGQGGDIYILETETDSLRLNRDYISSMRAKRC